MTTQALGVAAVYGGQSALRLSEITPLFNMQVLVISRDVWHARCFGNSKRTSLQASPWPSSNIYNVTTTKTKAVKKSNTATENGT